MTNKVDVTPHPEPSRGRRPRAYTAGGTAMLATAVVITAMTAGFTTAAETASAQTLTDQPAALDVSDQAPETVLLPTGDRVRVQPDGAIGLLPAEGREDVGFLAVPAADGSGDTIIVPQDKSDEILSGTEDSRRYNVTRLIAEGQADAADVESSELGRYAGLPPTTDDAGAEGAQTLTVAIKDRSGGVPDYDFVRWVDVTDIEHEGILEFDADGVATADLTPGTYFLAYDFSTDATGTEPDESVHGLTPVVIGDQSMGLLLDGAKAQPVTVEVDRPDATMVGSALTLAANSREFGTASTSFGSGAVNRFLMPQTDVPGYELAFEYQPTLSGSEGGPYEYNLAFAQHGGLPDDTAYSVADDELAAVHTEFNTFGKDAEGYSCDIGGHVEPIGGDGCFLTTTSFPSERLELYTADPAIRWNSLIEAGRFDAERNLVDGFRETESFIFEPGETERTIPHGPLTAMAGEYSFLSEEDGMTGMETQVNLGAGVNDGRVGLVGYAADATLLLDGRQVGQVAGIDPSGGFGFDLTDLAADRYTLAVEGTRGETAATGPFATASAVEWTFDLDPTSVDPEGERLSFPAVGISADGMDGGWAEDRHQELTLELLDGQGGAVTAREMTFEVSYNNGRTWTEIDVALDGSTGTVELDHPRYARYVSTRMTALDEAGTEVTQTTIRSYGLR